MPIYDYECRTCGHGFQVVQTLTEHEKQGVTPPPCPTCKSEKVERVIRVAFVKTAKKS